jgi:UDP-2,3-diacylglucosamine pyrophosphatase LpxH
VCCGHTHVAAEHIDQAVAYFNSGCWTELPCSYLAVTGGEVRLHFFEPAAKARQEIGELPGHL